MQDLYSKDSAQETRSTTVDHAGYTAPTRQHELDRSYHRSSGIYLPCLADLDEVGIDHTDHADHTDHLAECASVENEHMEHLSQIKQRQHCGKIGQTP